MTVGERRGGEARPPGDHEPMPPDIVADGARGPSPRLGARALGDLWFASLAFFGIYRRLVLLERPVSPAVAPVRASTSMHVAVIGADGLAAYLSFRPDQTDAEIRRRLAEGHACFAVWHGERIVHAAWAAVGRAPIEYLSRDLVLGPDEVFVFDAFTAPAFRGRGASPLRALAVAAPLHANTMVLPL